jgi:hypothetical protein
MKIFARKFNKYMKKNIQPPTSLQELYNYFANKPAHLWTQHNYHEHVKHWTGLWKVDKFCAVGWLRYDFKPSVATAILDEIGLNEWILISRNDNNTLTPKKHILKFLAERIKEEAQMQAIIDSAIDSALMKGEFDVVVDANKFNTVKHPAVMSDDLMH